MSKGLDGDRNVYLETVNRMEPEIDHVDASAFYASAAISLKRIADTLEHIAKHYERQCENQMKCHADQMAKLEALTAIVTTKKLL